MNEGRKEREGEKGSRTKKERKERSRHGGGTTFCVLICFTLCHSIDIILRQGRSDEGRVGIHQVPIHLRQDPLRPCLHRLFSSNFIQHRG